LVVLLLSQVNMERTHLLVHFLAQDFLIVCIVSLNASIQNSVLHDLLSSGIEDLNYVCLVVTLLGKSKT
jgi:hypothetical protein